MADSGAPQRTPRQQRALDESTPAVRQLAENSARRTGMTKEELFSIGMEALLTELQTYETWDVPFLKVAYKRIRGAIIDASRKDRRTRQKSHAMELAAKPFDDEVQLGDPFEPTEMRRDRYEKALYHRAATMLLAVLQPALTPEDELETEDRKQRIRQELEKALAPFPPEDQTLFRLHKLEELPLTEAAQRVGMHIDKARPRFDNMMSAVGRWFARAGQRGNF